ncbi:ulp1 protease family protein [Colletotrichum plurivorum]|uniref:Ulp1 protease family protein n=1 Tax=Colletotrichum plurivorum TaxID=2175906 RepID=A0A8H6KKE0_9PEZI|nr:ulp1 protease family protein [Colletotrichum plurivorum]
MMLPIALSSHTGSYQYLTTSLASMVLASRVEPLKRANDVSEQQPAAATDLPRTLKPTVAAQRSKAPYGVGGLKKARDYARTHGKPPPHTAANATFFLPVSSSVPFHERGIMPPTRSSQPGFGQSTPGISLMDIPSDRIRADVERLCRRWDTPPTEILAFFGVDCFTLKFLSAIRDLRARVSWDVARGLLEAVRDGNTVSTKGDRRTRSAGPRSNPREWTVDDISAAIRRADALRQASAQRTRSRHVSGVPTPDGDGQTSPSIRSQTTEYHTPTKQRTPGDCDTPAAKAEPTRKRSPENNNGENNNGENNNGENNNGENNNGQDSHGQDSHGEKNHGESNSKELDDDADDEKAPPPKRRRVHGRAKALMAEPEQKPQPEQQPQPEKRLEIPDSEGESLAAPSCPATPWPKSLSRTLLPEGWLNDEAVHGIISMLVSATPNSSNVVVISPLLITRDSPDPARALTSALANNPETLLLPMHLKNHWALLVVRPKARTAELFDSMPTNANRNRVADIFKRFAGIYLDSNEPAWEVVEKPCPEQGNDYDCGVFTVAVAAYTLAGRPLPMELAADSWRHTCCLLADPEMATDRGAFAGFLDIPMSEAAPKLQPKSNDDHDHDHDDVKAFQDLRALWIEHFEKRVKDLTKCASDLRELDAIHAALTACLAGPPQQGNVQDDGGSELERNLRNVDREIELRTQLSALPDCAGEMQALPTLRKRQARLRQQLDYETSRGEARRRIKGVLAALGAQAEKAERDAAYKKTIQRLNQYRHLFIVISCDD